MTGDQSESETGDAAESAPFRFEYRPGVLRYGDGCVNALGDELARQHLDGAIVVTGRTVGSTEAVIGPVREGLGDRFAGLFAETTPDKRFSTAVAGAEAFEDAEADAVVGLGGGSSLDVARAVCALAASDRDPATLARELATSGNLPVSDDVPPLFVVPTTLAGADLSQGGGIWATPEGGLVDEPVKGGIWDPALLPAGGFYDPALFATTPRDVLAASAMNGFDKGIETLYSRNRTAITDATATRGLRRFAEGLLAFEGDHEAGLSAAVEGALLVQYGISQVDGHTLSVIHALAKRVARAGGIQQGVAHAIVAPDALAAVFEAVDGRRGLLADALGVTEPGHADPAAAVVDRVRAVRNALGTPTRLRDVEGLAREDFGTIASAAHDHSFMEARPPDFDPTVEDLEAVLEAAW